MAKNDFVIHTLNRFGLDFKVIIIAIHIRETLILFEEPYDKLLDHEIFLKQKEEINDLSITSTNFTYKSKEYSLFYKTNNSQFNKHTNNFCNHVSKGHDQIKRNGLGTTILIPPIKFSVNYVTNLAI